eukprot:m.477984 g.477984  ORF g.477984 m.477984 type:complete len:312 (-) comp21004_c0_seq1:194-1129(-)
MQKTPDAHAFYCFRGACPLSLDLGKKFFGLDQLARPVGFLFFELVVLAPLSQRGEIESKAVWADTPRDLERRAILLRKAGACGRANVRYWTALARQRASCLVESFDFLIGHVIVKKVEGVTFVVHERENNSLHTQSWVRAGVTQARAEGGARANVTARIHPVDLNRVSKLHAMAHFRGAFAWVGVCRLGLRADITETLVAMNLGDLCCSVVILRLVFGVDVEVDVAEVHLAASEGVGEGDFVDALVLADVARCLGAIILAEMVVVVAVVLGRCFGVLRACCLGVHHKQGKQREYNGRRMHDARCSGFVVVK